MTGQSDRGNFLLNTDGGMRSSGRRERGTPPDLAAIGVVLRTPRLVPIDTISKTIGNATHNVAEYQALIDGLMLARRRDIDRLRVYLDSELVVDQMSGSSTVKQSHLKDLNEEARRLASMFSSIRISWIPRELNKDADALVRTALGYAGDRS